MDNKNDLILTLIKENIENIEKKFDVEEFIEIMIEISKLDKEYANEVRNNLFVCNNNFYKQYKDYEIDKNSYNLGMYDLFNKIINLQFNNLNKIDYEKEIRLLKDKQKLILDIIYENDGVDSKYIEKQLNISPQYLYNLTNDKKILKLIIINKNYRTKKVFYSLTSECRKFLDKTIDKVLNIENYYEIILNQKFGYNKKELIDEKGESCELRRSHFKYNS